jgi:hypothetical protein
LGASADMIRDANRLAADRIVAGGLRESRSRPNAGIATFTPRPLSRRDEAICQRLCNAR